MAENPRAFPLDLTSDFDFQRGMTLRDYFAAQALSGLIYHYHPNHGIGPDPFGELADVAYQYADKMLAEREK